MAIETPEQMTWRKTVVDGLRHAFIVETVYEYTSKPLDAPVLIQSHCLDVQDGLLGPDLPFPVDTGVCVLKMDYRRGSFAQQASPVPDEIVLGAYPNRVAANLALKMIFDTLEAGFPVYTNAAARRVNRVVISETGMFLAGNLSDDVGELLYDKTRAKFKTRPETIDWYYAHNPMNDNKSPSELLRNGRRDLVEILIAALPDLKPKELENGPT